MNPVNRTSYWECSINLTPHAQFLQQPWKQSGQGRFHQFCCSCFGSVATINFHRQWRHEAPPASCTGRLVLFSQHWVFIQGFPQSLPWGGVCSLWTLILYNMAVTIMFSHLFSPVWNSVLQLSLFGRLHSYKQPPVLQFTSAIRQSCFWLVSEEVLKVILFPTIILEKRETCCSCCL